MVRFGFNFSLNGLGLNTWEFINGLVWFLFYINGSVWFLSLETKPNHAHCYFWARGNHRQRGLLEYEDSLLFLAEEVSKSYLMVCGLSPRIPPNRSIGGKCIYLLVAHIEQRQPFWDVWFLMEPLHSSISSFDHQRVARIHEKDVKDASGTIGGLEPMKRRILKVCGIWTNFPFLSYNLQGCT